MTRPGMGIAAKLIIISTVLLGLVVGLFGLINSMQTRRIIDEYSARQVQEITESLKHAGATELRLLSKAVRVALVQSDYATMQTVVRDLGTQDRRITMVAVADNRGMTLAHSDRQRVGSSATGPIRKAMHAQELQITPSLKVGEQECMGFAAPLEFEGERLGTVFLALSLKALRTAMLRTQEVKQREVRTSLSGTLLIGLLSLLVGAALTVVQGLRMSRPVQALARQAERMAQGDLEARVEINSRDEIGMLGTRFNHMAEQILELMHETKEKATMEKELEVAKAVQATLVPASRVARLGGVTLAGYFKPATQCGGDWWSYFELAGGKVMVIIGDVTGHGVGSAMITAAAKGATSTLISASGGRIELRPLLRALNDAILSTARGEFAMTCFASIYDPQTQQLAFSNAGHNPPYVRMADGEIAVLAMPGDRLGDRADSDFEVQQYQVKPMDMLFWYTDGIVEGEDSSGEPFGERRFQDAIREHGNLPPDEAMKQIISRADSFYGGSEQRDDITLVVGRIAPPTPGFTGAEEPN